MGKRLDGNKQLLMDDAGLRKLRNANFLYHSAHNGVMVAQLFSVLAYECVCVCEIICDTAFIMDLRSGTRGCGRRPSIMED